MNSSLLAALAVTLVASGCAVTEPYAEVSGERTSRADSYEERVIVMGVDGKLDLTGSESTTIEPRPQVVVLASVRKDRRGKLSSKTVTLNAKACLRYTFAARHERMTEIHPWQLVLKNVEPIPECVAKFPDHAPQPMVGG